MPIWARSSAGRALRSHRRGRGFDPLRVHQIRNHLSENWGDFSFDHRNTTDGFQKILGMAGCYLPSMPQFIIFGILYSSDFILGNQSGIMRLIQAKEAFDGQHLGES